MRCFSFAVVFLAFGMAYGAGQTDFSHMIRSAAESSGATYIVRRDAVVALGETALPWLAEAATDESLTWQERLTARICFERIAREDDIRELLGHDWQQHPNYQGGLVHIVGRHVGMGQYVRPEMRKTGLWYTYIETVLKRTGEAAVPSFDKKFDQSWPGWAKAVIWEEPERQYLMKHVIQRLDNKRDQVLHSMLSDGRISASPSALVKAIEDFSRESGYKRYDEISDLLFTVISLADVSHHASLDSFLQRFPGRTRFLNHLEKVKTRKSSVLLKEPPFRLGTEPAAKVLERIAAAWAPAFRQAVPDDFAPTPANAVLDLRTPERLVWRVDGPLKSDLSRETRFFVQARKEARPEAWCSVASLHPGVCAVGLGEGALLVAHRAYGAKPDGPIPFGDQAALTVHRLERFSSDASVSDTPAMAAVFAGDTYGDSSVVAPTFEYPARKEIEEQLQSKSGSDVYRLSFKALATVEGSAQRQIARGDVRGDIGHLRRFLREGNVEAFFARHHPLRDLGREGMTYWNGADWKTAAWRDPDPPKPDPIPRNLDLDIQL